MKNLSVIIHTCDTYEFCWRGFFYFWNQFWINKEYPVYFCAETKGVKQTNIINLPSGEGEWSDRLMRIFDKIDTQYVFYIQEDMWLQQSLSPTLISEFIELMEEQDVWTIYLTSPWRKMRTLGGIKSATNNRISFLHPRTQWLWNHQAGVRRTDIFQKNLVVGETPWVNEIEGTRRLQKQNLVSKFGLYPLSWYRGVCQRGSLSKWAQEQIF